MHRRDMGRNIQSVPMTDCWTSVVEAVRRSRASCRKAPTGFQDESIAPRPGYRMRWAAWSRWTRTDTVSRIRDCLDSGLTWLQAPTGTSDSASLLRRSPAPSHALTRSNLASTQLASRFARRYQYVDEPSVRSLRNSPLTLPAHPITEGQRDLALSIRPAMKFLFR